MSEKLNTRTVIYNVDECVNSNPNGNPARQGEPRIDTRGYGLISAVSRRKKARLIMEDKNSLIWVKLQEMFAIDPEQFLIARSDKQDQKKLATLSAKFPEEFLKRYWDIRVFGTTMLFGKDEEGGEENVAQGMKLTGVVQTGIGMSIGILPPITYATVSVGYSVKEGQGCTLAPDAIKVIPYAIYKTKENIDGFLGNRTNCSLVDLEVFKRISPYIWTANKSQGRSDMTPIHIHAITFKNPLDMRFDREIEQALTPRLKDGVMVGNSREDFIIPTWDGIKDKYEKYVDYVDLAQQTL